MGNVTYVESLKRGNQTLTDKVESLESSLLTEKQLNNELRRENYMLECEVKRLKEKIKELEVRNKRPSSLEEAIKNSCENIMTVLGGGKII